MSLVRQTINGLKKSILWLFVLLALNACALLSWDSQAYIVRPKETLYAIAWRYSLDYRELAHWNNIPPPYIIHPGDKIWLRPNSAKQATPNKQPSKKVKRAPSRQRHAVEENRRRVAKQSMPPPSRWFWPTQGKITKRFKGSKSTSQGITVAGKLKQAVLATASGKVVYSGQGIIGHGKLVIVKHNETYLSAYAHNHALLVQEGEKVSAGQKIAEMGRSNTGKAMLHFEIRKNGKPVDPLRYLPAR